MRTPATYRQRPPTIEAIQWDGTPESTTTILRWIHADGGTAEYHNDPKADRCADGWKSLVGRPSPPHIAIHTLDGIQAAHPSDWIIRDARGFNTVHNDDFNATWEPAVTP